MYSTFSHIRIAGFCASVPEQIVTISELMEKADSKERFIIKRVAALAGLKQRHVAQKDIFTTDLAIAAGKHLLKQLKWPPESINTLFMATLSPDYLSPPIGYLVASDLGISEQCAVFDITAGCTGLLHIAWLAAAHVTSEQPRALLIGGDISSKFVPPRDIGNSVLMGDGVGAMALEYTKDPLSLSFNILSYPDTNLALVNYDSGYHHWEGKSPGMHMDGNAITEFCLTKVPQCINEHLKKEQMSLDDVEIFFLHQPNKMILDTLKRRFQIGSDRLPMIFQNYANCSSASLAINVCHSASLHSTPQKAIFCTFGSGLSVISMVGIWDPHKSFDIMSV